MFHPVLEAIASVYIWFWIGIAVLFAVDWSFGYDKVSDTFNRMFNFIGHYIPVEATSPIILLTIIGCFCKVMEVLTGSMFFVIMVNLFGSMCVGYIVLLAVFAVLAKGLTKLRNTSIARREEKARKKSLTDSE